MEKRGGRGGGPVLLSLLLGLVVIGWATAARRDTVAATATHPPDGTEQSVLRTQVAVLQTQVAQLQTQVAQLEPPTPGTSAEPSPKPVTCGQPYSSWGSATADNIRVGLLQVRQQVSLPTPPKAGSRYVALEVTIENRSADTLSYRGEDFRLTDCLGHEVTAIGRGLQPGIAAGEVAPGAQVRGWITFVVPDNVQAALFRYAIEETNRSGAQVRFKLVNVTRPIPTSTISAENGGSAITVGGCHGGDARGGGASAGGNGGSAVGGDATGGTCGADAATDEAR